MGLSCEACRNLSPQKINEIRRDMALSFEQPKISSVTFL